MIIFKLLHLACKNVTYLFKKDYRITVMLILLCMNVKEILFKSNMNLSMISNIFSCKQSFIHSYRHTKLP